EQVYIGPVGITSVAVGQAVNTTNAAVYAGTRSGTGTGTVVVLNQIAGAWQTSFLGIGNTSQCAYVLGVRSNADIIIQMSPTNAPDQSLSSLTVSNSVWSTTVVETNASHRGFGTVTLNPPQKILRL